VAVGSVLGLDGAVELRQQHLADVLGRGELFQPAGDLADLQNPVVVVSFCRCSSDRWMTNDRSPRSFSMRVGSFARPGCCRIAPQQFARPFA
jgi:hypothetical protein